VEVGKREIRIKIRVEKKKTIRIALAGNPNSGKTSIFNHITRTRQRVGNWPGVTVEKKIGFADFRGYHLEIVDLPGTYSLTAYSEEERIARSYIIERKPDVVINVIDAGNLSRSLYLTVQLLEMGADVILDLNMWDEVCKSGAEFDLKKLEELLGTPVALTVGHRGEGVTTLLNMTLDLVENRTERHRHVPVTYGSHLEHVVTDIAALVEKSPAISDHYPPRWVAVKLLEGDQEVKNLFSDHGQENRELTSAVEEGWQHIQKTTGSDPEKVISESRYGYIDGALREVVKERPQSRMELSRQIDRVLTNRLLGYPIFLALMWLLFQLTFSLGAYPMAWIESGVEVLAGVGIDLVPPGLIQELLVDGIIGGVGSVIVFLPNIMILFLGIAFLEDSGYMARAAFITDRVMHFMGLHGKSFIPMLMGFGCSVPAIMATRTLESRKDRILTTLVIPLMSCSARLPVYILFAGVFFPKVAGNVIFLIYMTGIVMAFLMGRLFRQTLFRGEVAPFVMELPPYRWPTLLGLFIHMWERAKVYLRKMGGVILVASVILWFLGAFPRHPDFTVDYDARIDSLEGVGAAEAENQIAQLESARASESIEKSYIGRLGHFIEPLAKPLGFDWRMGVSLLTGFVAKEVVVSSMGVLYQVGEASEESESLKQALKDPENGITPLVALGFMLFVLLYTPCVAAVVAVRREAGTRWMLFSILYQVLLAWAIAFMVYQIGSLLGFG
jgi:ferrous iron transport protein B